MGKYRLVRRFRKTHVLNLHSPDEARGSSYRNMFIPEPSLEELESMSERDSRLARSLLTNITNISLPF